MIASEPRGSQEKQEKLPQLELDQDLVQDNDGGDSLTSSLAIEGFVQGAPEDFTVQSQMAAYEVDEV